MLVLAIHITVTMFAVFPKLNPAKEVKIFNLYSYRTLFHFTLSNYITNCFIWPSVALGLPDCKALSDSYLENNHCIGEEILSTNYPTQFKFSVTEETEILTALSFRVLKASPINILTSGTCFIISMLILWYHINWGWIGLS